MGRARSKVARIALVLAAASAALAPVGARGEAPARTMTAPWSEYDTSETPCGIDMTGRCTIDAHAGADGLMHAAVDLDSGAGGVAAHPFDEQAGAGASIAAIDELPAGHSTATYSFTFDLGASHEEASPRIGDASAHASLLLSAFHTEECSDFYACRASAQFAVPWVPGPFSVDLTIGRPGMTLPAGPVELWASVGAFAQLWTAHVTRDVDLPRVETPVCLGGRPPWCIGVGGPGERRVDTVVAGRASAAGAATLVSIVATGS